MILSTHGGVEFRRPRRVTPLGGCRVGHCRVVPGHGRSGRCALPLESLIGWLWRRGSTRMTSRAEKALTAANIIVVPKTLTRDAETVDSLGLVRLATSDIRYAGIRGLPPVATRDHATISPTSTRAPEANRWTTGSSRWRS